MAKAKKTAKRTKRTKRTTKPESAPEATPEAADAPPAGPPPAAENPSVPTNVQLAYDPAAEQRTPRAGSKRARVLERMLDGTGISVLEVMELIGWPRRTALEGIRLIHHQCGYGLRTDEAGRITAYGAPSEGKADKAA